MRHIAVPGFAAPPCNGLIEEVLGPPAATSVPMPAHRSLPIVNADGRMANGGESQVPQVVWICRGCGKTWEREPLLDEAL